MEPTPTDWQTRRCTRKGTLVKCVVGDHRPDGGAGMRDGREQQIDSPVASRTLGIGMVCQHSTVVPGMTVAENLLCARGQRPAVIERKRGRAALAAFMETTPFRLDLDATPQDLSACDKQKLEILKQLYLKPRLLILDEPTAEFKAAALAMLSALGAIVGLKASSATLQGAINAA